MFIRSVPCVTAVTALLFAGLLLAPAAEHHHPAPPKKERMIAGAAEALRALPKRFARLLSVDPAGRRVTLLVEGDSLAKGWTLTPDAEVKADGWWGRLEQFRPGDRVWAWFHLDRQGQANGILMLADELSEQDIHGRGVKLESHARGTLVVRAGSSAARSLKLQGAEVYRGKARVAIDAFRPGDVVYVKGTGDRAQLVLDAAAFEVRRTAQKDALRRRWRREGLPGTVTFLHLSGELDFMADHEAMRWTRSLRPGNRVTLLATPPIEAEVQQVHPWRERTQVRLVLAGADLGDLSIGQRLGLRMAAPPAAVESADLPPDVGSARGKAERVEWFLATIYCPCGVPGDVCTGDFYTLASCNPNGCGMPNLLRRKLGAMIDKGMTDRQVLDALLKEYGPGLLHQHLRP
jgi:hypothetical protein